MQLVKIDFKCPDGFASIPGRTMLNTQDTLNCKLNEVKPAFVIVIGR